ncbi:hypothetical protein HDU98_004623 [Podochytrium sp. JEL0797]|nr:hypothetical protein HDU98_004623 [Podochytrium sp. JEL0797]
MPISAPTAREIAVLSTREVKHAAIQTLHKKQRESKIHHFTDENLNDHVEQWKVVKVAEESVAYGTNYFAKVCIGGDKHIHVRIHESVGTHPKVWDFYSMHETIKGNVADYIWAAHEELEYFNY